MTFCNSCLLIEMNNYIKIVYAIIMSLQKYFTRAKIDRFYDRYIQRFKLSIDVIIVQYIFSSVIRIGRL